MLGHECLSIIFYIILASLEHPAGRHMKRQEPASKQVAEIIFFDPEDGGDMFLRNVGCNSTDYTASHPRR
jgi:hypothetical protein